jgi:hypothetical protein
MRGYALRYPRGPPVAAHSNLSFQELSSIALPSDGVLDKAPLRVAHGDAQNAAPPYSGPAKRRPACDQRIRKLATDGFVPLAVHRPFVRFNQSAVGATCL